MTDDLSARVSAIYPDEADLAVVAFLWLERER